MGNADVYGIYAFIKMFSYSERVSDFYENKWTCSNMQKLCNTKALPMNKFIHMIETDIFLPLEHVLFIIRMLWICLWKDSYTCSMVNI
jgi:hypothetical protein